MWRALLIVGGSAGLGTEVALELSAVIFRWC